MAERFGDPGGVLVVDDTGFERHPNSPAGELAYLVTPDLAQYIKPASSQAAAALAVVASTPDSPALLSASTGAHWQEAFNAFQSPVIPPTHLQDICRVLRA